MSTEPISIERIHRDEAIQSRVALHAETVADYADAYREGKLLPPITLFHESGSGKLWLADGWHRVAAAEQAGIPHILADVKPGGRRDALLCSVGANATHGLRRTNADKRRAVELLLKDSELVKMSDREIARYCCVSHPFVSSVRSTGNAYQSSKRTGADGKTRAVKHWGLSNGMPFWTQVEKFNLDKSTIMERLQPGAKVLTDLAASKEDTWRRLDQLACEANTGRYPADSYALNKAIDTYGRVMQAHSTTLRVTSLATGIEGTWLVKDCKPGTEDGYQAWRKDYHLADTKPADNLDMAAINADLDKELATLPPHLPVKPASDVEMKSTAPTPSAKLEVGDTVRNIHTNQGGPIVGFVGDAAQVETANGVRPIKRAYLERIEPTNNGGVGEHPRVLPPDTPPAPPTSPKGDSETPSALDAIAPRPWVVTKGPDRFHISDRKGQNLAFAYYSGGIGSDVAYAITRAVNAHRDYTTAQVRDLLPALRRILDFADGLTKDVPDTITEDIFDVQAFLGHLRHTIAKGEQPDHPAREAGIDLNSIAGGDLVRFADGIDRRQDQVAP